MSFWDWLLSKLGGGGTTDARPVSSMRSLPPATPATTERTAKDSSAAPQAPSPAGSASSGPEMTNIRVTAPSDVRPVLSIQPAIELMRTLPIDENPDLVLRVLRKTLRSTGVDVADTIKSAQKHEEALLAGVATDRSAIEQLEEEIKLRKANIERLESELEDTRNVRARLAEALQSETKIGPLLPPEEIARIQAEANARKAAKPAPSLPSATSNPSASSKRPPPKLPSFPPAVPKTDAAKISVKPAPKPTSEAPKPAPTPPPRPQISSIPDIAAIDDGFDEKTKPGGED